MPYFAIIRGPLGVGKTTVARRIATELRAEYISIDRILADRGLWSSGRLSEFVRANAIAARQAREAFAEGIPVIFDGNFYWKGQIRDLVQRLDFPHAIFTLQAPLGVCLARDARRKPSHGPEAARQVYAKTTAFEVGVPIDAKQPVSAIVRDIGSRLTSGSNRSRL
jgi:predicted kinase